MDSDMLYSRFRMLDNKINIYLNEFDKVDPGKDGLIPATEGSATITGLLGGKGFVDNGTSLDDVTHGGIYFLNSDYTYKSVPFGPTDTGNYRMQLTVVRNFGANPWTNDPLVYQRVDTIELSGIVKSAYRFYYGKWLPWYYPAGRTLWSGSQATDGSTVKLAETLKNFNRIRITWQAYNRGIVISQTITSHDKFSITSTNVPNVVGSDPALSVIEIMLAQSSDGLSLSATGRLYYIQNSVTYNADDSKKSSLLEIVGFK